MILTTYSFINMKIFFIYNVLTSHGLDMRAHVLSYFTGAAAVQRLVDRLSGAGDPRAGPELGGWECVSSNRAGASWRFDDGVPLCEVVGRCPSGEH